MCPHSMPCVKCLLFAYYIYINKFFKFKICYSILRCQTAKKYLPVPVILCCLCCPLRPFWLDRVVPVEGDTWQGPSAVSGGPAQQNWPCRRAQTLDPGMEREESCSLVWKPGVSSQHAGLAILTLGLCSSLTKREHLLYMKIVCRGSRRGQKQTLLIH